MSPRWLALAAAVALLGGGPGSAAALTLEATADTFVSDDSPMSNFGSFSFVEVGVIGLPKAAIVRGLLTFDLSAVPPGIGTARLQFVLTDAVPDPPNLSVTVTRLATDFGEHTVTWDTQPADLPAPSAIAVVTQPIGGVATIDVTALVQAQRLGAMPNTLSLRIAATDEMPGSFESHYFDFATREADPPQAARLLIDAAQGVPAVSGGAWLAALLGLTAVAAATLKRRHG